MKLNCSVSVQNRLLTSLSIRPSVKHKNALISVAKPGKASEVYLILFTHNNKSGDRYKLHNNIEKTFVQFINEGKCTIRFKEPSHDLCISADAIPLKNFMLYIKKVCRGDLVVDPTAVKEVNVSSRSRQKTLKLEIKKKEDYPALKGFPRTLQYLSICDCKLSKLDSRILKLNDLTTLTLRNNALKTIPEELGNLKLEQLYLDNNDLKNDNWRFLLGTVISKSLKILDLSSNGIRTLPPCLSRFLSLNALKVGNNFLTTIPFRICLLPKLRELNLSRNAIKALPGTITRKYLKKLDILDVAGNEELSNWEEKSRLIHRKGMHNTLFSLLELAAQRIIESRIEYNEEVVTPDLVRLLDIAGQCFCGKITIRGNGLLPHTADVNSLANIFVATNRYSNVPIVFTACSRQYATGSS